jgi:hypothetical protein
VTSYNPPRSGSRLHLWHGLALSFAVTVAAFSLYFVGGVHGASPWGWRLVVVSIGIGLVLMQDGRWHSFGRGLLIGAILSVASTFIVAFLAFEVLEIH